MKEQDYLVSPLRARILALKARKLMEKQMEVHQQLNSLSLDAIVELYETYGKPAGVSWDDFMYDYVTGSTDTTAWRAAA